jgi:hypothetical protein
VLLVFGHQLSNEFTREGVELKLVFVFLDARTRRGDHTSLLSATRHTPCLHTRNNNRRKRLTVFLFYHAIKVLFSLRVFRFFSVQHALKREGESTLKKENKKHIQVCLLFLHKD